MKTLYFTIAMLFTFLGTSAQSSVNPDLNLEANTILQNAMETDIRYYYYPNLQAYFDTETLTYIYSKNNEWVEGAKIPSGYKGYSVSNGAKVAIPNYNGDTPYEFIDEHRKQFPAQYLTKRQPPVKTHKSDTSILAYN